MSDVSFTRFLSDRFCHTNFCFPKTVCQKWSDRYRTSLILYYKIVCQPRAFYSTLLLARLQRLRLSTSTQFCIALTRAYWERRTARACVLPGFDRDDPHALQRHFNDTRRYVNPHENLAMSTKNIWALPNNPAGLRQSRREGVTVTVRIGRFESIHNLFISGNRVYVFHLLSAVGRVEVI